MDRMFIRFVELDPETETNVILYEEWVEDRWGMEQWQGCTFRSGRMMAACARGTPPP